MRTKTLGGLTVSAIGLGGMPMSIEGRPEEQRSIANIHAALDAGVTLIDTADAYHTEPGETGHNDERGLTWPGAPGQATRGAPPSSLRIGRPAAAQPVIPSLTFTTFQPAPASACAAWLERLPARQIRYTGSSCGISVYRAPSCPSGMCIAPGACPAVHSSGSRTSTRNASAGTSAAGTCAGRASPVMPRTRSCGFRSSGTLPQTLTDQLIVARQTRSCTSFRGLLAAEPLVRRGEQAGEVAPADPDRGRLERPEHEVGHGGRNGLGGPEPGPGQPG